MGVLRFLRYTASSVVSAVVDTGCFTLFSWLFHNILSGIFLTSVAGVLARVISSLLNFFLNKKMVFEAEVSTGRAMLRYYALAIPQMAAQVLLTQAVCFFLHIADTENFSRTVVYVIVMSILYIASFLIQKFWVFAGDRKKHHN